MSVARIYEAFREQETDPARRLGWQDAASQVAHHAALFALVDTHMPLSGLSVRDLGCGDGAAVPWVESRGALAYQGVDMSAASVAAAQVRWPGRAFACLSDSTDTASVSGPVDITIAIGTLAYHGAADAVGLLDRAWATSRVGVAFSSWHDVPLDLPTGPLAARTQSAVSAWAWSRRAWCRVRPDALTAYWVVLR